MIKKLLSSVLFALMPIALFARPIVGIVGDSISVPLPIKPADGYIYLLEDELDFKLVNYSIGGSTTRTLLPRLKEMFERHHPDIVIIALGINDGGFGLSHEEVLNNLKAGVEYVLAKNVPLFVGTVDLSFYNWHNPIYCANFKNIYINLKHAYPQIELYPFMTFKLINEPSYFAIDEKVHPNPMGHRRIADEFKALLKAKLDLLNQD